MLPTCPACGQSVLDDEAVDCPFCGASMSAKPGKTKAPAKPVAQKPAGPAKKKKPKAKPKDDSENPFEAAPSKAASAIQAAPKPMKGRLLKVTCPMCDTPGFIPKKAAGRNIRCANKKCMVPVFKAPAPKKQPVAEPETSQGSSAGAIIGGVLAIAVVGGVLWAVLGRKAPVEEKLGPATTNNGAEAAKEAEEKFRQGYAVEQAADTGPAPLPELRAQILEKLETAASHRNADKPFCRRMNTEALAAAGQIEKARAKVNLIGKPGEPKYYQRAFGYSEIAWACIRAGDTAGAQAAVAEAEKCAGSLPAFGRTEFDVRISVAAAMAGAGQFDEAVAFMSQSTRDLSDQRTHTSAMVAADAAIQTAFVETSATTKSLPAVADWADPAWVATAMVLCARGKADVAANWAARAPGVLARTDALAAVAGYAAAANQPATVAAAVQSATADGSATIARVNAAAAFGASTAKLSAPAGTSLTAARKAMAMMPEPKPAKISGPRELYDYKAPDPEPSILAAIAVAEVARAEAEMGQDATATLAKAIRHTHTFSPSPDFMEKRLDEDVDAKQLAITLRIPASEASSALMKFKGKRKSLATLSDERRELQSNFLGRLAESRLGDAVWKLANPKAPDAIVAQERFGESTLPWKIAAGFLRTGKTDAGRAIVEQLGESDSPALQAEISSYMNPDRSPRDVAVLLSPRQEISVDRLAAIYRFSERYSGEVAMDATDFAKSLGNNDWKREALRLVGARLARTGHSHKLAEIVDGLNLAPSDETAIYRGLVSGIQLDPAFTSESATQ